ncbi:MAG: hypothetical protein QME65_06440 [Candidatus Omnitrophota bacterium]|nr:hypothetical protein [Candidatus Omnitrophota bacterium]
MKKKWEVRDVLLLLIFLALVVDILLKLPARTAVAETFELDRCITASPGEKPGGFVHVVTH